MREVWRGAAGRDSFHRTPRRVAERQSTPRQSERRRADPRSRPEGMPHIEGRKNAEQGERRGV